MVILFFREIFNLRLPYVFIVSGLPSIDEEAESTFGMFTFM